MKGRVILFSILFLIGSILYGQNEPVVVEAESGVVGSDYNTLTEGDVTYITPGTDMAGGTNPGTADKVASFTVDFADSGTYKLFARVRVGPANYNDDSFFYGNDFGSKSPSTDADWILCNGGFTILKSKAKELVNPNRPYWGWITMM